MRSFRSEVRDQEFKQLLHHLLGNSNWSTVFWAVLFLVSLGWFADGLFSIGGSLIRWGLLGTSIDGEVRVHLVLLLPFLGLLGLLLGSARRWRARLPFRVRAERPAHPSRALILFLSRPTDEQLQTDMGVTGTLAQPETLQKISGKWRMPLEAIAYHRERLRELVVIDSSGTGGSRAAQTKFLSLLDRLWPSRNARVRTVGDFLPEFEDGVDFFDLEQLVQVTDEIVRRLVREGLTSRDVLIDVTGGTKLVTAAGSAVTLAEGRRFQYVDTMDYEVMVFEPGYEATPR